MISNWEVLLLILSFFLLIITIVGFAIVFFNRHKKKTMAELELEKIEKNSKLEELQKLKVELKKFISQNKEFIKQNGANNFESQSILVELHDHKILTDDDWDEFSIKFNFIFPNFFTVAKIKMPQITTSELRFLALAKLNFNNKEIASCLGVSPQTPRVTWHRIKKKNSISKDVSIVDFIETI